MSLLRQYKPTLMLGRRPLSGTVPAFTSTGAIGATSGSLAAAPAYPASGALINDIFILNMATDNNSTITCPAGWQPLVPQIEVSANYSAIVFWRRANGTENGGTVSCVRGATAANSFFGGRMTYYRGVVPDGFPFESISWTSGTGTSMVGVNVPTCGPNRRVLHTWAYGGAGVGTAIGGIWSNSYNSNSTVGDDGTLAEDRTSTIATAQIVPAPTRPIAASEPWVGVGFALLPS